MKKHIRGTINKTGVPLMISDVDDTQMKSFVYKLSVASKIPKQVKRMSYYDYLHRKPIVYETNSDTFARRPSIRK